MTLRLGISPCPNDTFVFHAWVHGLLPGAPAAEVELADIDVLNTRALAGELDVVKVSYGALPELLGEYRLLSSGGALGRGCGPLLLARPGEVPDLARTRVAVPGLRTTAYALLRLWAPVLGEVVVLPFEQIMPAVRDRAVGAGLVIHEARFTYPDHGLELVQDLGEWWEAETGLPVPLGAIVVRRSLGDDVAAAVERAVRESVEAAWRDPAASREWVAANAQELAPEVVQAHIDLYVNEFTRDLGDGGRTAVDALLSRSV
jgi:1,4-dihydroxy-6-naphthoate synthase